MTERYTGALCITGEPHRRSQKVLNERQAARRLLAELDAGYDHDVLDTVARRMLSDLQLTRSVSQSRVGMTPTPVASRVEPPMVQVRLTMREESGTLASPG